VAPYPDVAPFAGSSFDCCDLLQRNVIYHGTGKASGISSWYTSQIVRLQKIGLKRRTSAFGALGPISKARVKLEALGNVFMVKAVKLDIKLRKLANGNYSAFFPGLRSRRRRDGISVKQEPPTKIRGSGGRACVDWFQAVRPVDWFHKGAPHADQTT